VILDQVRVRAPNIHLVSLREGTRNLVEWRRHEPDEQPVSIACGDASTTQVLLHQYDEI
jgi:hypothetical protein